MLDLLSFDIKKLISEFTSVVMVSPALTNTSLAREVIAEPLILTFPLKSNIFQENSSEYKGLKNKTNKNHKAILNGTIPP